MANQRRQQYKEQITDPTERTAVEVLCTFADDGNYSDRESIEFWCDAAGINPEAFFWAARRYGGTA